MKLEIYHGCNAIRFNDDCLTYFNSEEKVEIVDVCIVIE